jgi:hypothetical protein
MGTSGDILIPGGAFYVKKRQEHSEAPICGYL